MPWERAEDELRAQTTKLRPLFLEDGRHRPANAGETRYDARLRSHSRLLRWPRSTNRAKLDGAAPLTPHAIQLL